MNHSLSLQRVYLHIFTYQVKNDNAVFNFPTFTQQKMCVIEQQDKLQKRIGQIVHGGTAQSANLLKPE
jgi:hypothetical protein